ncbi:type II toxin-antitoxin system VapC family toxin [Phreatobacter sp. AB_2022a]|uniref:PIN domain-containing protein n=1 Tax=Phreatobacter sp. AB_2022a TaxID=3003134 RepID=UPI0022874B52|nr:type II toxin-antitoxin system VapC family toxin [Phreatobacter sp. AB_2022a]
MTSPLAVWEVAIAVARVLDFPVGETAVALENYLVLMKIELAAVPPQAASLAIEAFDRHGKGRHPAQLNFGDCFSYACARRYGQPRMLKGPDFSLTDIEAA